MTRIAEGMERISDESIPGRDGDIESPRYHATGDSKMCYAMQFMGNVSRVDEFGPIFKDWIPPENKTQEKKSLKLCVKSPTSTGNKSEFGGLGVVIGKPALRHDDDTAVRRSCPQHATSVPSVHTSRLGFIQQLSTITLSVPVLDYSKWPASCSASFYSDLSTDSRLFQTEYFEVCPSPKGGMGAFAIRDIARNTVILKEKALLKSDLTGRLYSRYEALSPEQKKDYQSLYGYTKLSLCPIQAKFMTNRFMITNTVGGIFFKSSRFNHACNGFRLCSYRYDHSTDSMIFTTTRKINRGSEITISYTPKPRTLPENYGFSCDCLGCSTSKQLEKLEG